MWFRRGSRASDMLGDCGGVRVAAGASGPAQSGARRSSAGRPVRRGGRGAARHGTHAAPLTAAFPALDGPPQGTCTSGAQHVHVPPRESCDVACQRCIQHLRPYRMHSTTSASGLAAVAPTFSALRACPRLSRAQTAGRSTRRRSFAGSRCAGAGPTSWCAGRAAPRRATRGSRRTTSPALSPSLPLALRVSLPSSLSPYHSLPPWAAWLHKGKGRFEEKFRPLPTARLEALPDPRGARGAIETQSPRLPGLLLRIGPQQLGSTGREGRGSFGRRRGPAIPLGARDCPRQGAPPS